jgi:16S rRNA (guanine1207-N2)-methyltransferase
MSHYFKNDERLKHDVTHFDVAITVTSFRFFTDLGVFSKSGIDFGTRVLLENIVLLEEAKKIIDMGCGYGPIGIYIAKKNPQTHVFMYDVNDRALELALRNARANMVSNVIIQKSNLFMDVTTKADVIITNPPIRAGKDVVFKLYEDAYEYLNERGFLYVVIQKKQGAPSTFEKLTSIYKKVEVIARKKGYWVISARK